jgi:NAD(P)-dependent dehydrogenase (short-subunit alcohol dehydrogenase family)
MPSILIEGGGTRHPADWADIYNQNVVSFVRMVQHFGPRMREMGWGRIINISSGARWRPFASMPDYAATKAAILNLTVSLAKEFTGTGVTVNTVSPGIIVTESNVSHSAK